VDMSTPIQPTKKDEIASKQPTSENESPKDQTQDKDADKDTSKNGKKKSLSEGLDAETLDGMKNVEI
jgi:hypothetical protein